jgi:hypothetical protein
MPSPAISAILLIMKGDMAPTDPDWRLTAGFFLRGLLDRIFGEREYLMLEVIN